MTVETGAGARLERPPLWGGGNSIFQGRLLLGEFDRTKTDIPEVTQATLGNFNERNYTPFQNYSLDERRMYWLGKEGDNFQAQKQRWVTEMKQAFDAKRNFFTSEGQSWAQFYSRVFEIDAVNFQIQDAERLWEDYLKGTTPNEGVKNFVSLILGRNLAPDNTINHQAVQENLSAIKWLSGIFGANSSTIITELTHGEAKIHSAEVDGFINELNQEDGGVRAINRVQTGDPTFEPLDKLKRFINGEPEPDESTTAHPPAAVPVPEVPPLATIGESEEDGDKDESVDGTTTAPVTTDVDLVEPVDTGAPTSSSTTAQLTPVTSITEAATGASQGLIETGDGAGEPAYQVQKPESAIEAPVVEPAEPHVISGDLETETKNFLETVEEEPVTIRYEAQTFKDALSRREFKLEERILTLENVELEPVWSGNSLEISVKVVTPLIIGGKKLGMQRVATIRGTLENKSQPDGTNKLGIRNYERDVSTVAATFSKKSKPEIEGEIDSRVGDPNALLAETIQRANPNFEVQSAEIENGGLNITVKRKLTS